MNETLNHLATNTPLIVKVVFIVLALRGLFR